MNDIVIQCCKRLLKITHSNVSMFDHVHIHSIIIVMLLERLILFLEGIPQAHGTQDTNIINLLANHLKNAPGRQIKENVIEKAVATLSQQAQHTEG